MVHRIDSQQFTIIWLLWRIMLQKNLMETKYQETLSCSVIFGTLNAKCSTFYKVKRILKICLNVEPILRSLFHLQHIFILL